MHEQSSGEPCYSWNVVHTWQLGDRPRFLEGMYGLLTGAVSDQTFIACEHRNGMYGNLCTTGLITWMLRISVIDDEWREGELHLLRLCPLAWLSTTEDTVFEAMPTVFGPVNLRLRLSAGGDDLLVTIDGARRHPPRRVAVHVPPVPGLRRLVVDGRAYTVSPGCAPVVVAGSDVEPR